MRSILLLFIISIFALPSCQNLEGTEDNNRKTFVKIYEGPYGYDAAGIESTPEGFVLLANTSDEQNNPRMVLFKVDKNGNRISESIVIDGGHGADIKAISGEGFVIIGDSIYNQANPGDVNDFQIISSRIFILNNNLDVVQKIIKSDEINPSRKTDYRSTSITVTPEGKIVSLGTYQEADDKPVKPYILTLSKIGTTYQHSWFKPVSLLDQNYQNAKSVFYKDGKITWATAIANEQQNFNFSYVSIPTLQDGSVFTNNSLMGSTTEQLMVPGDIHPFGISSGYGIIGTYGTTTRSNKNIFFTRIDENGSVINGSEKYFDAMTLATQKKQSETEDTGDAIASTSDHGFVLAGTFATIPDRIGNGGRDIFLIKTDDMGEPYWSKKFGGSGDESVRSVKETGDGSIIIFGTNDVGGFSSIFLIKTNASGEL